MENEIAVSIICNAYNHEKYIRDALDGFVKQQTSFPFEVLIHDDASTDNTANIIREYEKKYPTIINPVYQKENQYSKHNRAIFRLQSERAKGKYVAMCEGDDYWTDPLKLQKQYDFMESHPDYTLCGCSTDWLNNLTGKIEHRGKTDVDRDITLEDLLMPDHGRPFPYVSFFMPTEIWRTRPNWGFPVGDLPLTYYAAMCGKVHMLADTMCVYRWFSEGSWTARKSKDEDRIHSHEQFIRALDTMNRETEYQYDELIRRRIRSQKYALALLQHDFKAIKSDELIGLYKKRDFIHRLSDRMHCTMPKTHAFILKLIGKSK